MTEHPYLVGNLAILPLLVAAFIFAGRERRTMLASGIAAAPLGLTGFLPPVEAGWYWHPNRLGGLAVGIEDILFLFVTGAMTWFFASFRRRLDTNAKLIQAVTRYCFMLVLGVAALFGCQVLEIDFTITCCLIPAGALAWLLILQPSRWPLAFSGSLGLLLLYAVWLRLWLWGFPTFLNPENSSGVFATTVVGIPIGEIVWAFVFGAAHPLCVAYMLNVKRTNHVKL